MDSQASTEQAATAANPIFDTLLQRISLVEEALNAKDPSMKTHLAEIHRLLINHDELVHLLSDEDIGKFMKAQQAHQGVVLVAALTGKKASSSATKKATGVSLDDL